MFKKILQHKFITGIILLLIITGGYFSYQGLFKNKDEIRYLTAAAEKGTLIVSVSGSGQVSVSDEVAVKPKVSGEVSALYISENQKVKTGQLLLDLDSKDAEESVKNAQIALDNAKNDLEKDKENYESAKTSTVLSDSYGSGYSTVSTSFFKLSGYMKDLKDVLGTADFPFTYIDGYKLILGQDSSFIQRLLDDYSEAESLFNQSHVSFREIYRDSESNIIYQLIEETLKTTEAVSEALESARHMFDAIRVEDYKRLIIASYIETMQTKIESNVSSVYSNINSLQSIKDTIDDTIKNSPQDIEDARLALRSAENNVYQKEKSLSDAKNQLTDCSVRAMFDGIIIDVDTSIKKGDSISANTILANLITQQKIATISLNEVDAAKVKVDQKATLSFDALPDLTVSGKVAEVDAVGTVSQGVVSYGVKIAFDSDVEGVKPGMSLTADIITDVRQDVLVLSNSAVKSQGNSYYVELVEAPEEMKQQLSANISGIALSQPPKIQPIEIGLSNDLSTEIVSGLKEGDIVVTSTVSSNNSTTTTTTKSSQNQGFQIMQFEGGGGPR